MQAWTYTYGNHIIFNTCVSNYFPSNIEPTSVEKELMYRKSTKKHRDRIGRDRMVVGFTTTYAISVYHH